MDKVSFFFIFFLLFYLSWFLQCLRSTCVFPLRHRPPHASPPSPSPPFLLDGFQIEPALKSWKRTSQSIKSLRKGSEMDRSFLRSLSSHHSTFMNLNILIFQQLCISFFLSLCLSLSYVDTLHTVYCSQSTGSVQSSLSVSSYSYKEPCKILCPGMRRIGKTNLFNLMCVTDFGVCAFEARGLEIIGAALFC